MGRPFPPPIPRKPTDHPVLAGIAAAVSWRGQLASYLPADLPVRVDRMIIRRTG